MKTIIATFLLCLTLRVSFGQEIDLFSAEYAQYPTTAITENDSVEISFTEYEFSGLSPLLRKEKFNLVVGATYQLIIPANNEGRLESNLFLLGLNLIGAYNLSESSKLIINAFPSFSAAANSKTFTGDSFLFQGGVFYNKKVSDRFTYNIGIISTTRFGSPIFLPLLGMTHTGEIMKLEITLPTSIIATWNHKNPFSYGLRFSVNGSQFGVDGETTSGEQVDLARFSRVRLGPQITYRLKGPMVLSAFGGMAVGRTYEFEIQGFDDVDFSLENGPFISARLAFRPQMGNN